jgi:hypothetical protein
MNARRALVLLVGLAACTGPLASRSAAQLPPQPPAAQPVPQLVPVLQYIQPAQPPAVAPAPIMEATALWKQAQQPMQPMQQDQAPATAGSGDSTAQTQPAKTDPACPPDAAKPALQDVKFPFKWSWGGQARVEPDISNFPFHPLVLTPEDHTQRVIVERLRFWVAVNPNEHVEAYTQVQFGGIQWGSNADFSKTFPGPRFPPVAGFNDFVGIVLRRAWLAYSDDDWGKVRAGFLDWHDSFGDTLASSDYDFQIGGVEWSKTFKECNNARVVAAALFLSDLPLVTSNPEDGPGTHTAWLFTLDADQPIDEQTSVGASVYYLPDAGDYSYATFAPYKSAYDVWLGVRGKTVLGVVPVNGFFLYNFGDRTDAAGAVVLKHNGFAAKAEAGPLPLGPGKLSAQALFATGSSTPGFGDTAEFRTVAQSYRDNFGAQGYWSYMHLTTPNGPDDVQDLGVSLQDRGLGLFTVQAKYEYPLCGKLSGTSAAGWFRSAKANPISGSSNIGTELAQQFTYDFGGGLKLDTGAAWLITGDFYKPGPSASTPRELYEVFARLQLEF